MNYYNDFDSFAAQWLKNLIADGLLPAGDVDNRPIQEVKPSDLKGYIQCHFFAGIGGWARALQLAGWPSNRPVWTGSCPCQPFSVAGKQEGESDKRHLWPEFYRLISECRPSEVIGEQVASALGRKWLSGVRLDLEALGYAVGAADLCAAGVSAPHIRQRLWWVADSGSTECLIRSESGHEQRGRLLYSTDSRNNGGLADSENRHRWSGECGTQEGTGPHGVRGGRSPIGGTDSRVGYSFQSRLEGHVWNVIDRYESGRITENALGSATQTGRNSWAGYVWIPCADGKARRIEPGIMPLVNGVSGRVAVRRTVQQPGAAAQEIEHWYNRVGAVRGFGNAIVPEVAAGFIMAYLEAK